MSIDHPFRGCPISPQATIVDNCVVEVLYHHTTYFPGTDGLSSDSRDQIDPGTGQNQMSDLSVRIGHRSGRRHSNSEVPYTVVYEHEIASSKFWTDRLW